MTANSLASTPDAKPIHGLFARAYRDLQAGRVRMPSMPDVAVRLRAAMQAPDVTQKSVARIIQTDSSTAGYLVAVANSPIYRGVTPAASVELGVMRLGLVTTRNLVTAHAMRAMFHTRSKALAAAMRRTWMQSARTAAFASLLATRIAGRGERLSPDRAMLAGLVMDMGCLPLLRALHESGRRDLSAERVDASLETFAPRTGAVILERWQFDPDLVEVARHRHAFDRTHDGPGDLVDLALVARRLALVGNDGNLTLPPVTALPAFAHLDLDGMGGADAIELLLAADEELKAVMQLLGVAV